MDWRKWLVDHVIFRRGFLLLMLPFTMIAQLIGGFPKDSWRRCAKEWGIFLELWGLMAEGNGVSE